MRLLLVLVCVAGAVSGTYAAPILQIVPPETIISPGDSGHFEVRLADATNLAGFYLELTLAPAPGALGMVEFVGASGDENQEYCFYGFNDLFQAVLVSGSALALGDQTDPHELEVATFAGQNDLLAIVEVNTSYDAWGTFDLTLDETAVQLFDKHGSSIPDFESIFIRGGALVVPEPTAIVLIAAGTCFIACRRSRRKGE